MPESYFGSDHFLSVQVPLGRVSKDDHVEILRFDTRVREGKLDSLN